jgi:hypothetical protein
VTNSTGTWIGLSSDPLLVAVIGAVIGFGSGVALSYGTFLGGRYLKALGKHKLLLIATLKRELPNDHLASYDGDRLIVPTLEWGKWDSPSIKVLGHLQTPSYSQVLATLMAAQKGYATHIKHMESERAKFESHIDKAIGEPVGMVRWTGSSPGPQPWYALSTIRKILFESFRIRLGGGYAEPVPLIVERFNRTSPGPGFQLSFNRTQVATGSEEQMSLLEERIRPLLDNEFLRECVRRINGADTERVSEPTRKKFDDARGAILERLELKSEAMRGKCPLCPGFLRIHPVDGAPA